ncbi:MAG: copper resistance protein CopC [Magnetospirillum sp.]|nr:copper resistance protein CopC [Magnetospirillum sp.]
MLNRRSLLLACLACAGVPGTALAHAALTGSTPPQNGSVPVSGFPVELRFSGRIDANRSRVTLTLPGGQSRTLAVKAGATAEVLAATVDAVPPGPCQLRYTVLSVDGHLTSGTIAFTATGP